MRLNGIRPVLIAAAIAPAIALACIHPPSGYKGATVSEREKLAFLFHDGVNTHLVLRTVLAAKGGLPEMMAWVVPLPSLPSKYEETSAELFEELRALIPRNDPRMEVPKSAPTAAIKAEVAKAAPQILVHEKQVVGSYQIQPIEILAESAGGELNAWLTKNGFSGVPPENQKHYLKKGAVFLALRVDGLKGAESELKPLHIVYRGDRLQLPLKFSTHSGVFDVRLYALTEQAPSRKALEEFGLEVVGRSYEIGAGLSARAPNVVKLVGDRRGHVSEFRGAGYNDRWRVADWREDPWLMPTGRGPGGEPGKSDSAATWPGYPLIGVLPDKRSPYGAQSRSAGEWLFLGALTLPLLLALWWLHRCTRTLAGVWIARATAPNVWAGFGNRTMLLGLSAWAVLATGAIVTAVWDLWGYLIDAGARVLGWGGLAILLGGATLRLAAKFRKKPDPAT